MAMAILLKMKRSFMFLRSNYKENGARYTIGTEKLKQKINRPARLGLVNDVFYLHGASYI